MVNREMLRTVLEHIDATGSFPIGGTDAELLTVAARAYLELPDQPLADLINQLGETRAILHRNAMNAQVPQDRELLQMMFNTVSAAMTVIQQVMVEKARQ